jgi:hypothetical protein
MAESLFLYYVMFNVDVLTGFDELKRRCEIMIWSYLYGLISESGRIRSHDIIKVSSNTIYATVVPVLVRGSG